MRKTFFTITTFALLFIGITVFAAWIAPIDLAPNGNFEPPINAGVVDQEKLATITARGLCIRTSPTALKCFGETPGLTPVFTDFPWVINNVTKDISSTNDQVLNNAKVLIKDAGLNPNYDYEWILDPVKLQKMSVEGKVKASGFCLGNDCVSVGTSANTAKSTIVNNWRELINKYAPYTGPETLKTVTDRDRVTTNGIAVGGLLVEGGAKLGTAFNVKGATTFTTIKIVGGTPGPNKVLVSIDNEGNAVWKSWSELAP